MARAQAAQTGMTLCTVWRGTNVRSRGAFMNQLSVGRPARRVRGAVLNMSDLMPRFPPEGRYQRLEGAFINLARAQLSRTLGIIHGSAYTGPMGAFMSWVPCRGKAPLLATEMTLYNGHCSRALTQPQGEPLRAGWALRLTGGAVFNNSYSVRIVLVLC